MSEFIDITEHQKNAYNNAVAHPMQSYEWGEFRKVTGITVIRRAIQNGTTLTDPFTLTLHKIPKTPWHIGYLPKTDIPSKRLMSELQEIGRAHNCIFLQLEPNITTTEKIAEWNKFVLQKNLVPAFHPLFTKYTFTLDITPPEDELLASMHSKTRYNIRVADRHGVTVSEDNSDHAFEEYLRLTQETTTRQKFYAHTPSYHKKQWAILPHKTNTQHNLLSSHLLTAVFQQKVLTAWILFVFKDTLYYPYGASSSEHRNVMASNAMMWEAIRFGKKLGLKSFDMWGALSKTPDTKDPWYGFHRFKEGYGATHTEFVGSYDLVIQPRLYTLYKVSDKLRWLLLRMKK